MINQNNAVAELRRAYNALAELAVGSNSSTGQLLAELQAMYVRAFQAYNRGELQNAELQARALKHLCRAAWYDAKIKYLESHSEDLPHVVGLNDDMAQEMEQLVAGVENRIKGLKLIGQAERFGARARKHVQRMMELSDVRTLLADSFVRAAHEYSLATELFHHLETASVNAA